MGTKEIKAVGWTSDDEMLRIRVTGLVREVFGNHAGRIKYIWTIHSKGQDRDEIVWKSNDHGQDGAVYSGVGAPMNALEGIKSLVTFLDAWHEAKAHGSTENADLFIEHSDGDLFDVIDQYGDEMYADLAMDDLDSWQRAEGVVMVEDSDDPQLREYR